MAEISNEYGAALFSLALEAGREEECAAELESINSVISETPEYIDMLASPSIPLNKRLGAISDAFSEHFSEQTVSFLQLLCEKGRIRCFPECLCEYNKLLNAHKQSASVCITSALELTDDEKAQLKQALESKYDRKMSVQYRIDESILGGIVVEFDGQVLDGSLRTRLKEIKDVIGK